MNKKLTLSVDDNIINSAKLYAQKNNVSISQLVQTFLKLITKSEKHKKKYPPITSELLGILRSSKKNNIKKDYADYLSEKYK
jgi:antitoxin component of RelBE/YafQ-DinJ toxin-antitoxin module